MDLRRVQWDAAAGELHDEHRRTGSAKARRALAGMLSLRARFTDDYAVAVATTAAAIALEPLEPLHRVRDALARLRFGDLDGALARLDGLAGSLADLPLVLVVKALATARRGEPRTARNIADRALQVDPRHAGAKFLHTEANLAAAAKGGLDKLGELPHGNGHDAAWADLLSRLSIMRPGDHRAVAQQLDRGVIAKASRGDLVARTIATWSRASLDELVRAAEAQPAGSRAEQLALALAVARSEPTPVITALRVLHQRCPDRPAIRRALVAAITRLAVDEAAAERWMSALRAVQVCLELEPAEPAHHQNRAVLFTLAGEHDAALDAWAELDRVHYVSALLGRLEPASCRRYAAPHRMFAQAARLSGRTGVFLRESRDGEVRDSGHELALHQELIDRDPEQLRHWLHHARASLVFELVSLGPERMLLAPGTPAIAAARAEAMSALARSLEVLVPDEGRRLATALATRFRAAATGAVMHYAPSEGEPVTRGVHRHAVELFADLALVCLRWEPDPGRPGLLDEVMDSVRVVAPLFDERVLAGLIAEHRDGPPDALRLLDSVMRIALELHDREPKLDAPQRQRLAGFLLANLRVSAVERRVVEAEGALGRLEIEGLVEQLEQARKDDPRNARLECCAAHLLMAGDFLDEAVAAITAFHAIAKGEHPLAPRIARIQELIDEKRKHGAARARSGAAPSSAPRGAARDLAAREIELEHQPSSIQRYGELCHELALAGRWRDAHAWAGRALARCLTPAGQLRARELALQLTGLEALDAIDPGAVAGFIAGARASALPALDKLDVASSTAGVEYVRGLALLAADRRRDAQAAFSRALERTTRGIFLPLLRPLASDVETAVLEAARQDVDAALAAGQFREAFARIAERVTSVVRPAPYVLELARTQLAALLPTIGTSDAVIAPPPIKIEAPWAARLTAALQTAEAPARIRALCALATEVHEPSARDAAGVLRKLDELDEQLAIAAALDASIKLATAGDLIGALNRLAGLGARGAGNPRVLRHQVIVQLRLDRLADADATVALLAARPEPIAREFCARYPALKFRQQIAAAIGLIRARDFAPARAALATILPAELDQHVELAYCRAYCAAAEGYRALDAGDRAAARPLLFEALAQVEARLSDARTLRHERLLELYGKLEADLGKVEGAHA